MYALFLSLCNSHFKLFVSIIIIIIMGFVFSYILMVAHMVKHVVCCHFTEACKTYHRSLIDARTRRSKSTAEEHKQTCRRQGRKRDVSLL